MLAHIRTVTLVASLFITSVVLAQPPLPEVPQPTFNVRLTWVAPTTNTDGSPLTDLAGYKISYSRQGDAGWTVIDVNDPAAVMHVLTENVLEPNTQYFFTAQACNDDGICSRYSNVATGTTPDITQPNPPTNVTVNITFNAGV